MSCCIPCPIVLHDANLRPLRRLDGAATVTWRLNQAGTISWDGSQPCGLDVRPWWHHLSAWPAGEQYPLWLGPVTSGGDGSLSGEDLSAWLARLTISNAAQATQPAAQSVATLIAMLNAEAVKGWPAWPVKAAQWFGRTELVLSAEIAPGATLASILDTAAASGTWWTMQGPWLRHGVLETWSYLRPILSPSSVRTPHDVIIDDRPISQVVARNTTTEGRYPADPVGPPPFKVQSVVFPNGLTASTLAAFAANEYATRAQTFARGTVTLRDCGPWPLRELFPGRWLTWLDPRMINDRAVQEGFPVSGVHLAGAGGAAAIITEVEWTIAAGMIVEIRVTLGGPDDGDKPLGRSTSQLVTTLTGDVVFLDASTARG